MVRTVTVPRIGWRGWATVSIVFGVLTVGVLVTADQQNGPHPPVQPEATENAPTIQRTEARASTETVSALESETRAYSLETRTRQSVEPYATGRPEGRPPASDRGDRREVRVLNASTTPVATEKPRNARTVTERVVLLQHVAVQTTSSTTGEDPQRDTRQGTPLEEAPSEAPAATPSEMTVTTDPTPHSSGGFLGVGFPPLEQLVGLFSGLVTIFSGAKSAVSFFLARKQAIDGNQATLDDYDR